MTQSRAFFRQARLDLAAAITLEAGGAHIASILMCLQMAVEKTAKGYTSRSGAFRPTHGAFSAGFVHLQTAVLNSPRLRSRLGRPTRAGMSAYLQSIHGTAVTIERLNPSVAGRAGANCEYPWEIRPGVFKTPAVHRFGKKTGRLARLKLILFLDILLAYELRMPRLR